MTIGNSLSQLLGLYSLVQIANLTNPESYGLYTFILMQTQLIITIGDLGIRPIIIRSIARDKLKTKDFIYNGILLRILSVTIIFLLYIIYNQYLGTLSSSQLLLICLLSIVNCFANLTEAIFWGHEKMLMPSIVNIIYSIFWIILLIYFDHSSSSEKIDIDELLFYFLCVNLLKSIALFSYLRYQRLIIGKVNNFIVSVNELLNESWPYFILTIVMIPVNYLTNNFLDVNSNKKEIAYFNIAQRFMGPISMILGYALAAIFPNLSVLWLKNKDRFIQIIEKGIKYYLITTAILCLIFSLFINNIVDLLFPEKYQPAIAVTRLQIWGVFFMGINSLIGTIWGAMNKEKLMLKTTIINSLISTPLLFYGSKYGALGISYAYLASFAIFEIYLWNIFKQQFTNSSIKTWILVIGIMVFSISIPEKMNVSLKLIAIIPIICSIIYSYKFSPKLKIYDR